MTSSRNCHNIPASLSRTTIVASSCLTGELVRFVHSHASHTLMVHTIPALATLHQGLHFEPASLCLVINMPASQQCAHMHALCPCHRKL
jgi:hypothetical protein